MYFKMFIVEMFWVIGGEFISQLLYFLPTGMTVCDIKIVQKRCTKKMLSRCGKMNKKRTHAETEQKKRQEKKEVSEDEEERKKE